MGQAVNSMGADAAGEPLDADLDAAGKPLDAALDAEVVIVGAGLSGIGAACQLQRRCPGTRFLILEARQAPGGTWDLFRYPGVRSDSDRHSFGYSFQPWEGTTTMADGAEIRRYLKDTARRHRIDRQIRCGMRVRQAAWSSATATWTLTVEPTEEGADAEGGASEPGTVAASRLDGADPHPGEQNYCRPESDGTATIRCRFLLMGTGYYRYEAGYTPEFPGREDFRGTVVHPQHWPRDLDLSGRRVVVIGSGATAVSLVPALAETAAHVVMLQRSPGYVVALPDDDRLSRRLRRLLPRGWVQRLLRWRSILQQQLIYKRSRSHPQEVRRRLLEQVRQELGDAVPIEPHFSPRYDPWDQRLCVARDGDLFAVLRAGQASIVTDTIDRFTPAGIRLGDGEEIQADVIVTATGLQPLALGDVRLTVDGAPIAPADAVMYRGVMLSDVPNLIVFWGYINASWTLRSELVASFACRLIRAMGRKGWLQCTPRLREEDRTMERRPLMDGFTPGYVMRNAHLFPQQGDREPWVNPQNYWRDRRGLLGEKLEDGVLEFSGGVGRDGVMAKRWLRSSSL